MASHLDSRQQQADQDCYDGNYHQQFHKGKAGGPRTVSVHRQYLLIARSPPFPKGRKWVSLATNETHYEYGAGSQRNSCQRGTPALFF
jgi:hypothetical protein